LATRKGEERVGCRYKMTMATEKKALLQFRAINSGIFTGAAARGVGTSLGGELKLEL